MYPMYALCCVLAVALGVCLLRLFKKDTTSLDAFRADVGQAALTLQSVGFTVIPPLMTELSQCRIRDFLRDGSKAVKKLISPGGAAAEAATLFANMLAVNLKDPTQAAAILAKAQQAVKAAAPASAS